MVVRLSTADTVELVRRAISSVVRDRHNCTIAYTSRSDRFDFTSTAANITTTLAGAIAFLTVADCDAGNRPCAIAAATSAAGRSLATAFRA